MPVARPGLALLALLGTACATGSDPEQPAPAAPAVSAAPAAVSPPEPRADSATRDTTPPAAAPTGAPDRAAVPDRAAPDTAEAPDSTAAPDIYEEGLASWYGAAFQGRTTASGIPFDRHTMVAAHPKLPFGTRVRVHRVQTGESVEVEIVDRGPAAGPRRRGVIIDLSEAAARELGFIDAGRTRVRLEIVARP